MRAIADVYGIERGTVLALAAGADAICVGGENADQGTAELLAAAVERAVATGELTEERLAEASARVAGLADWSTRIGRAVPVNPVSGDIGYIAARRAIRLSGAAQDVLPLTAPPHVVELVPTTNLAIGKETPWGVAVPLRERLPGTTFVRVHHQQLAAGSAVLEEFALTPASGRPMVVVVRDAARNKWMGAALADLAAARPDAIVVEMGLPGPGAAGAVQIFTHGATAASGVAAAEVLAGGR